MRLPQQGLQPVGKARVPKLLKKYRWSRCVYVCIVLRSHHKNRLNLYKMYKCFKIISTLWGLEIIITLLKNGTFYSTFDCANHALAKTFFVLWEENWDGTRTPSLSPLFSRMAWTSQKIGKKCGRARSALSHWRNYNTGKKGRGRGVRAEVCCRRFLHLDISVQCKPPVRQKDMTPSRFYRYFYGGPM